MPFPALAISRLLDTSGCLSIHVVYGAHHHGTITPQRQYRENSENFHFNGLKTGAPNSSRADLSEEAVATIKKEQETKTPL